MLYYNKGFGKERLFWAGAKRSGNGVEAVLKTAPFLSNVHSNKKSTKKQSLNKSKLRIAFILLVIIKIMVSYSVIQFLQITFQKDIFISHYETVSKQNNGPTGPLDQAEISNQLM